MSAASQRRRSWIPIADDSDFPLENLPIGVVRSADGYARVAVAIGERIVDLAVLARAGSLAPVAADAVDLFAAPACNAFLARGRTVWSALRATLTQLFSETATAAERGVVEMAFLDPTHVQLQLPIEVADYVDFYSSIEHATNLGRILRPGGEPLLPNYRHIPIGYHGRASTVVVSGTNVRRPYGQIKGPTDVAPSLGATRLLDFELELGFITGPGNAHGEPIVTADAREHIYGVVLLNDWSARDIQGWEYQPLGPFLSKSFATSISPWIVSLDALEPFRVPNREQEPAPLPYLHVAEPWAYDIDLAVDLQTAAMRAKHEAPVPITQTTFSRMYWNMAQQLAHMTINGSRIRPGDLYGSGTISGTAPGTYGSMIELTERGAKPLALPNGELRAFLEDGDLVSMRGRATRGELRIGFGEVRGTILA